MFDYFGWIWYRLLAFNAGNLNRFRSNNHECQIYCSKQCATCSTPVSLLLCVRSMLATWRGWLFLNTFVKYQRKSFESQTSQYMFWISFNKQEVFQCKPLSFKVYSFVMVKFTFWRDRWMHGHQTPQAINCLVEGLKHWINTCSRYCTQVTQAFWLTLTLFFTELRFEVVL